MAAPILWTPGKMRPFCRKNLCPLNSSFWGGGYFGFWGGGKCRFYFNGRGNFSEKVQKTKKHWSRTSSAFSKLFTCKPLPQALAFFCVSCGKGGFAAILYLAGLERSGNQKVTEKLTYNRTRFDLVPLSCLFSWGIAQLSRDTLQNGVSHRCARVKLSTKGGYRTILGECYLP